LHFSAFSWVTKETREVKGESKTKFHAERNWGEFQRWGWELSLVRVVVSSFNMEWEQSWSNTAVQS
jgi:hypothetical protein